jgi:hypothetical protein
MFYDYYYNNGKTELVIGSFAFGVIWLRRHSMVIWPAAVIYCHLALRAVIEYHNGMTTE